MMSEGRPQKRKSKAWYRKQAFLNKRMKGDGKPGHRLVAGLKGFIITCNDHERDAVKESYNILNEYADKLYGPETKGKGDDSSESDGDDIETAIAKEVEGLKAAAAAGERRFQNSQTGAKNCIFIKTTLEDPVGLAHSIFTDLLETKVQKSRHALRLLPVVGTCKANLKDITELAKVALEPFFREKQFEVTYTINFKARNNSGIGREMTVSTLRDTISDTFSSVLLNYTPVNPQITIMVEVMCGVACLAVARDFAHFRKYNLVEVVQNRQKSAVQGESAAKTADASVAESKDERSKEEENSQEELESNKTADITVAESEDKGAKLESESQQELQTNETREKQDSSPKQDSTINSNTCVSPRTHVQDEENNAFAPNQSEEACVVPSTNVAGDLPASHRTTGAEQVNPAPGETPHD